MTIQWQPSNIHTKATGVLRSVIHVSLLSVRTELLAGQQC